MSDQDEPSEVTIGLATRGQAAEKVIVEERLDNQMIEQRAHDSGH